VEKAGAESGGCSRRKMQKKAAGIENRSARQSAKQPEMGALKKGYGREKGLVASRPSRGGGRHTWKGVALWTLKRRCLDRGAQPRLLKKAKGEGKEQRARREKRSSVV